MKYRTETEDDGAEAHRQRIEHSLAEPKLYAEGPRAQLLRELKNAWRPGHPIQTLRDEIDARERGPRQQLMHELRDAHRSDAVTHNRIADAMDAAGLSAREKLAVETREMWRGA